jgi:TDG/mug DNA glycosylase family protein
LVRIEGLKPIVNEKSTVLILGSMPSKISIEKGQYYANPKNQFWKIIKEILGVNSELPYRRRKDILLTQGFALWDILKSCERNGSLDKNIRNPIANDLEAFLTKYEQINKIGFNGQKSMKLAKKLEINFLSRSIIVLPSSSPANTSSLAEKIVKWKSFLS